MYGVKVKSLSLPLSDEDGLEKSTKSVLIKCWATETL